MSTDPIRYGMVALGRAGWDIHVRQLRARPGARIVAVAEALEERRRQGADELGCRAYACLEDLLAQDEVEVVVIATPSACHGPDTVAALRAGRHVVVEKPMAMTVAEADAMVAAAQAADRRLFVHHNYRFKREFTHLRAVAESGLVGRVYHIRNYLASFARRYDWQTLSKRGGGVLNNTCPHYIDMILQLLGAPVTDVLGDLQQIAAGGDVEDHVKAFLRAANGRTADMEIANAQNIAGALPRWILCGSCGTLTCDGRESVIRWFDPQDVEPIEAIDAAVSDRGYHADQLPWQEKTVAPEGPDVGDFYDNVAAVLRHDAPLYVTAESARQVVDVSARIRQGTAFDGKVN